MFTNSKIQNLLSKVVVFGFIFTLVLGTGAIVLASPLQESHAAPALQIPVENLEMSSSSTKIAIPHFDHFGNFSGNYHLIDIELYYAIIDYILANGGEPNPRNVDNVYHTMQG